MNENLILRKALLRDSNMNKIKVFFKLFGLIN